MGQRIKVIFTKHSLERMKQRQVTRDEIVDTISKPTVAGPIRSDNTKEFRRKVGDRENYVVVEMLRRKEMLVITTGWTK